MVEDCCCYAKVEGVGLLVYTLGRGMKRGCFLFGMDDAHGYYDKNGLTFVHVILCLWGN